MGGQDFMFAAEGTELMTVFRKAREQASFEHGHGGYTGTIAEKHGVRLRRSTLFLTREDAAQFAKTDIEQNDKFGDAFAVAYGANGKTEGFILYGIASC